MKKLTYIIEYNFIDGILNSRYLRLNVGNLTSDEISDIIRFTDYELPELGMLVVDNENRIPFDLDIISEEEIILRLCLIGYDAVKISCVENRHNTVSCDYKEDI